MSRQLDPPGNIILLRGACLWLLAALVLAWCMVGLFVDAPYMKAIFSGKFSRVLQAHIDFLLMTALILGIYATKTLLPWHVRWAMVVGAFTNSSLFVLLAMFPAIDSPTPPAGFFPGLYKVYLYSSLILTSYGFGRAAVLILLATFDESSPAPATSVGPASSPAPSSGLAAHVGRSSLSRFLSPARRFAARRRLVQLVAPASGHDPLLLWLIFSGLTVFAFVLLWFYGLAQKMLDADPTHISAFIVALYVATSLHCFYRARILSREATDAQEVARAIRGQAVGRLPRCAVSSYIADLRAKAARARDENVDSAILLRVLAERLRGSNDFGSFASDSLMKLGLLGTIVGFIIMLAPMTSLDPENTTAVRTSMGIMSEGMAVAMYTTLTGLVASLLVKLQYLIVDASASRIFTSAVALTEVHVTPSLHQSLDVAA
jgi:MotA/TolQ/ExbB proton channel family